MATVTFKGGAVRTAGDLPAVGARAPEFRLAAADLSDKGLKDFAGKVKIVSIVPSLDTSVCALSATKFNLEAGALKDVVILTVSADLPFAQKRFCDSGRLSHITTLSTFRSPSFGRDYGVLIEDGPLAGLLARAVLVIDRADRVVYRQLVPEIAQEPDYGAALTAATKA